MKCDKHYRRPHAGLLQVHPLEDNPAHVNKCNNWRLGSRIWNMPLSSDIHCLKGHRYFLNNVVPSCWSISVSKSQISSIFTKQGSHCAVVFTPCNNGHYSWTIFLYFQFQAFFTPNVAEDKKLDIIPISNFHSEKFLNSGKITLCTW